MENQNGYFQVVREKDGIYIKLFPPKGNGKPVDLNEIREYLDYNKVLDCNFVELGKKINNHTKEEIAKVSSYVGYPINEYMKVSISEDKMKATARFYPPSNDGQRETVEEMKNDLSMAGVVFGVQEKVFAFQQKTPLYCTDFIVAKGIPVREGKNAEIEYFFNTDRRIKPKRNEDGTVNFHQLNNIGHIKKGDVLAELHPADLGESGTNVLGMEVKPHPVAQKVLKFGKNIDITEDKLKIISQVNGHALLEDDRVFVDNIYEVTGDVDNNTGDIEYEGNVIVRGNVRTGFKIKASGDVEVFGTVEGADIESGGRVILHRGMQGMTRGKIIAKGDVVSKFIESARVFSEGSIESEEIIQSQISAKSEIMVNGQRGQIIGGHIRSTAGVNAKNIGSSMGISTIIEVGYDPEIQDKIKELRTELASMNEEYRKCTQIAAILKKKQEEGNASVAQLEAQKKTVIMIGEYRKKIFETQDKIDEISESISNNENAFIKVTGVVNPGTQIRISGEFLNINDEISFCKFSKFGGEIKRSAL